MEKFNKAFKFAIDAHANQKRKLTGIPYIFHPSEVAYIASSMTSDEDLLCAALLHDTLEDTKATEQEILDNFGEKVLKLVKSESENKREGVPPSETWEIRKQESLAGLKASEDINVKILWLSDKLSNIRSFVTTYNRVGDELWDIFNQKDPKKQKWYYYEILNSVKELEEFDAYQEFSEHVHELFGNPDE